jgi:hypothetical protein
MKTLKYVAVMAAIFSLFGCAQNLWVKPNASQGEFERDRYACLQQAQQRVGAAQLNAYGGSAVNTVATNDALYSTCMGSRGWSLQNKEVAQTQAAQNQARMSDLKQQFERINENATAMCSRDELKEYYKKTTCKAPDVTFEQVADAEKITTLQKAALVKQREHVALIEKEQAVIQKQAGPAGNKAMDLRMNFVQPENEKNNLDLYNGKITWGEYNKRRKEIFLEAQARLKQ